LAQNEEERAEIRRRIEKLQVHDAKGALIKRQKESVDRVADALQEITRIQKDDVRQDLDELLDRLSEPHHERALLALGVRRLGVFGSFTRGQQRTHTPPATGKDPRGGDKQLLAEKNE
jgi:hypothetical protein